MIITNKDAKQWIKICNCCELTESIENYPESERDGRSDLQILIDEVNYRLSLYEEDTCTGENYREALEFMKETKRGSVIPCYCTIPPVPKYTPIQLEIRLREARNSINEYRRLKSLKDRLNKRGYY